MNRLSRSPRLASLALCASILASALADAQKTEPNYASKLRDPVLNLRIDYIAERDQQFRKYLAWRTLDDAWIARARKMDLKEQFSLMREQKSKGALSAEQVKLLNALQRKNDRANFRELRKIVRAFGYPSAERLGVKADRLFPILLHPPFDLAEIPAHLEKMEALLKPEVLAGRMPARLYATFVDNTLAKILRRPQRYGTNRVFDSKTKTIGAPIIADLEAANAARKAIGMPLLKDGEYQIRRADPPAKR